MKPWLVAHRGASFFEKENTLPAILRAKEFGAPLVEIDIRVTKDNIAILFHDSAVEGLAISKTNFAKLRDKDPSITTLKELDAAVTNEKFFVELKSKKSAFHVAEFLKKHPDSYACSFLSSALEELATFEIDKSRMYLSQHGYPIKLLEKIINQGFGGVSINKWFLAPWDYFRFRKAGLNIFVYTVNSKIWARMIHFLSSEIMICSDRIDKLKDL
jgi:glycerophosphoryl diester phosphodiesterase